MRLLIMLSVLLAVISSCSSDSYYSAAETGDIKEQATQYYLKGEAAFGRKDYVTALADWKTVLELKPSSAYTRQRIKALRKKMVKNDLEAYESYLTAVRVKQQGWDSAAVDACRVGLFYAPKAECLRELYESSRSVSSVYAPSQPRNYPASVGAPMGLGANSGAYSASVPDKERLLSLAMDYVKTSPKWAGPGGTSFNWRVKGIRYQSGDAWVDMANEHGVSYPLEYSYSQLGGWQFVQDGQDLAVTSPFAK